MVVDVGLLGVLGSVNSTSLSPSSHGFGGWLLAIAKLPTGSMKWNAMQINMQISAWAHRYFETDFYIGKPRQPARSNGGEHAC